ncbi:Type I secretion outer membrane protein [Sodalis praecaptivus]|uniref:Type I secretion outer membrane protein n=1 Tax=Sodalis praecaptivus TaxID=1239307 RepID=W0HVA2_9GAMM|nr:efflux transporter outer membrane subunit [Sodalis praecaptivus]AHF76073.1 Type I secretion outer membrane protein [Sodalis praecaptivus]
MANRFQRRRPIGAVCRQKELAPQPTARGKGRRWLVGLSRRGPAQKCPARRRTAGLALVCLLLTACGAPREPVAPSRLMIPPAWRNTVGPGAPVEANWWHAFGDPALSALVEQALRYNTDILTARARVEEYRARLRATEGDRLPTLDAQINGSRARTLSSVTGLPIHSTVYQGALQANYNVDLWGAQRDSAAAARATLEAQQAAAAAAMLTVASSVASGYFSLRSLDEQLALTRATLQTRQNSLNLARRQFETGYSSRLELAQSQAEYQAARAQIPQLSHQITEQENALRILVGSNPGSIARGADLHHITPLPLPSVLPSELMRRRPDIVQAERQLIAADASLSAARANLLPSINLTATGTLQDDALAKLIDNPFRLWSVGGSILAPLFNREALNAQVDIAAAARNQALYNYEKTVRNAFGEVNNSLDSILRLREQLVETRTQQEVVQEQLRIAHNRYANGYASYLEELDAQRTLYATQVSVIALQNDLLQAQTDLYRSLGGGWQVDAAPASRR